MNTPKQTQLNVIVSCLCAVLSTRQAELPFRTLSLFHDNDRKGNNSKISSLPL